MRYSNSNAEMQRAQSIAKLCFPLHLYVAIHDGIETLPCFARNGLSFHFLLYYCMNYYSEMTDEQKKAHAVYIKALRDMGPERRMQRAFELSDFTRQLFLAGLR
jgi:hypothetical protein